MTRPTATDERPKADVVVLAGGRGTRLAPYTTLLPKPLMPIDDMPVLEILLRRLRAAGYRRVHLAVGHLAELIEAFFGDGSRFGVEIVYLREDAPLGTAGPLGSIEPSEEHVLVMNGDLFTTLDFNAVVATHRERHAAATIAIRRREVPVEFGVVRAADGFVAAFEEKPVLSYEVSMGVYVFGAAALAQLERGVHVDFPEFLQLLLDQGLRVAVHRSDDFWLDIGRAEDYELAQSRFDELREAMLGET